MNKKTIWISFDLGFRGDYPGFYSWLDKYGAKECGDYLAVFQYKADQDILSEIEQEIKQNIQLSRGDRVYIIWQDDSGLMKGKFINGGRKRAQWQGYGPAGDQQEEDY